MRSTGPLFAPFTLIAAASLATAVAARSSAAPADPAKPATAAEGKPTTGKDQKPAPAADQGAPAVAWEDMDKDARKAFMKKTVLPRMKAEFAAFDAKKYAKFTCKTCHGPSAGTTYKMPNPKIEQLPADEAAFMAMMKKHPKMAEFMGKTVKPVMASLLGLPEMTRENAQGFGCGACHVFKK